MNYIMVEFNKDNSIINPLYIKPDPKECRICLEEEGSLICICGCKGTAQYVHKECIETWINTFAPDHINHKKCGICLQVYELELIDEKKEITNGKILHILFLCYASIGVTMLIIVLTILIN